MKIKKSLFVCIIISCFTFPGYTAQEVLKIGKIIEMSKVVAPLDAPYPDALFTLKVMISDPRKKEVELLTPLFLKRVLQPISKLKKGDKIAFILEKETPKEFSSMQIIDDIASYELEQFFIRGIVYKKTSSEAFKKLFQNRERLLQEMDSAISLYEKKIPGLIPELKTIWEYIQKTEYPVFDTPKGWFSISPVIRYKKNFMSYIDIVPYDPTMLQYLKDMRDFFKRKNIPLIVIIYPSHDEIFYDLVTKEGKDCPLINISRCRLIRDCLANDIFAVDLLPLMMKKRSIDRFLYLYTYSNPHQSGLGSAFAVEYLAELAGLNTHPETALAPFFLKSYYLDLYKGPRKTETFSPKITKTDRKILLFGDSFAFEGFAMPNALRTMFSAEVKNISKPSRATIIYETLINQPDSFFDLDAAFFVMNGKDIYNHCLTNQALYIKRHAGDPSALIVSRFSLIVDARKHTHYKLSIPERLKKEPRLLVGLKVDCPKYDLLCNGVKIISHNASYYSMGDFALASFALNRDEIADGVIDLEFIHDDFPSVGLRKIYVVSASGFPDHK